MRGSKCGWCLVSQGRGKGQISRNPEGWARGWGFILSAVRSHERALSRRERETQEETEATLDESTQAHLRWDRKTLSIVAPPLSTCPSLPFPQSHPRWLGPKLSAAGRLGSGAPSFPKGRQAFSSYRVPERC